MATITLTAAQDPGDFDTGTYAELKLLSCRILPEQETIELACQYGDTSETWAKGVASKDYYFYIRNEDGGTQHFDVIQAKTSAASGESYLDELERECYQWLIDEGHYAGTIS